MSVQAPETALTTDVDFSLAGSGVVSMMIPGQGSVIITCEIIYKSRDDRGDLLGLKFVNATLSQTRIIRKFVSAKTQVEADKEALEQPQSSGRRAA